MLKFTKEIKKNWLKALKSGDYKQGFVSLFNETDNSYCCIGVLGHITEGLNNNEGTENEELLPYKFLKDNGITCSDIWSVNDDRNYRETGKRDYSNVIPLIEQLPTID